MDRITELTGKLTELRDELQYGRLQVDEALKGLERTRDALNSIEVPGTKSNNIIRSFLVNFNISNMAEATILVRYRDEKYHIIEYSGAAPYVEHLTELLSGDPHFYKNTDRLELRGRHQKIYYESMTTEKAAYTLLTISESAFFRPSRFHMLSDILMDIIRSGDVILKPLYNDLFEDVVVDINGLISLEKKDISQVLLFRFEYITDFIENIGIISLIGLSDSILVRLNELFREEASIFRISLARFLIFFRNNRNGYDDFLEYQKRGKLDFSYRGIVLPHQHLKIDYAEEDTVYDLFEKIFTAQEKMAGHDVQI